MMHQKCPIQMARKVKELNMKKIWKCCISVYIINITKKIIYVSSKLRLNNVIL